METFSALLALCAGNSPVTGEFPSQRPVTRSFAVFFDLPLNKRLGQQWRRLWCGTPWRSLWCRCNDETAKKVSSIVVISPGTSISRDSTFANTVMKFIAIVSVISIYILSYSCSKHEANQLLKKISNWDGRFLPNNLSSKPWVLSWAPHWLQAKWTFPD